MIEEILDEKLNDAMQREKWKNQAKCCVTTAIDAAVSGGG